MRDFIGLMFIFIKKYNVAFLLIYCLAEFLLYLLYIRFISRMFDLLEVNNFCRDELYFVAPLSIFQKIILTIGISTI